jgi:hypothetical protein
VTVALELVAATSGYVLVAIPVGVALAAIALAGTLITRSRRRH